MSPIWTKNDEFASTRRARSPTFRAKDIARHVRQI